MVDVDAGDAIEDAGAHATAEEQARLAALSTDAETQVQHSSVTWINLIGFYVISAIICD